MNSAYDTTAIRPEVVKQEAELFPERRGVRDGRGGGASIDE